MAYDGTDFHGWQVQPDKQTIQGELNKCLQRLCQEDINVVGCGRTDAGVHASSYYCHFDVSQPLPASLVYKLNSLLPKTIVIYDVFEVDQKHARFDATNRSYVYHSHFAKNPFRERFSWYCYYRDLDWAAMQAVCAVLPKYTDFSSLSKQGNEENSRCTITHMALQINEEEQQMTLHVSANRFLHNMIRRIMGLLISVGRKQTSLQEVHQVLSSGGQFKVNFVAPPQGLFLCGIEYPFLNDK